jgi:hypothetical protein
MARYSSLVKKKIGPSIQKDGPINASSAAAASRLG